MTYRTLYDRLRHEGFIAGSGEDGFRIAARPVCRSCATLQSKLAVSSHGLASSEDAEACNLLPEVW
jgi:hypothetical protein